MAVNPNEDTEFNDALRKHGILPPKEKEPESPSPPPSPTLEEELDDLTYEELRGREEDAQDSDTERFIASLQRQKLRDEVKEEREARFGRVYPIAREDYTREVTEASSQSINGASSPGTGVVCFLYKDGHAASERSFSHIRTLAPKYPNTKFVSIVGDKCIPNYPDRNLPTLLLYRNGQVVDNLVAWGAKESEPSTIHHLETVLLGLNIVELEKMAPQFRASARSQNDDDDDEEDDRPTKVKSSRSMRHDDSKDDDSDFDL